MDKKPPVEEVIYVTVPIHARTLRDSLRDSLTSARDALEFIHQIDLSYADAGFTESIILERAKSLRSDLNLDERSQLVRAFSKAIGI